MSKIAGDSTYGGTESDVEIGQSLAISTSVEPHGTGLVSRFLRKLEIEPQPGSYAPGHLSNKGKSALVFWDSSPSNFARSGSSPREG